VCDKEKPTSARKGEVEVVIENQINDIILQRGTRNISKGKEHSFSTSIKPRKSLSMKIRASKKGMGRIRCYLIYELVRNGQEHISIMRNYRVFLAIKMYYKNITHTCTASVAMFMVKSCRFTGDTNEVKRLYDDILKHYHVKNFSFFKCNLAGRILELNVDIQPLKQSRIDVVLKETDKYYEYGPIFHRANSFA
jgi:hypothetical protein